MKLKQKNPKGSLILSRTLVEGKTDIIVNGNLLIRLIEMRGNQIKLLFKDLDPNKYNMVERLEIAHDACAIED